MLKRGGCVKIDKVGKVNMEEIIEDFFNRLVKREKHLKKWARTNSIGVLRLYDREVENAPVTIDLYQLIKCSKGFSFCIDAALAQGEQEDAQPPAAETYFLVQVWRECAEEIFLTIKKALECDDAHIIKKIRVRHSHKTSQYERLDLVKGKKENPIMGIVREGKFLFFVNLTSNIDTGLYCDMREMRKIIYDSAKGKSVLNLFSYTGSFSVAAGAGGARYIENVDLSTRYLSWAKENMALNDLKKIDTHYTKIDCQKFLTICKKKFDIIILDPPTFSNSKSGKTFDIKKDYIKLITLCLKILNKGGVLYFSTNARSFSLDTKRLKIAYKDIDIRDITRATLSKDFFSHRGNSLHPAHRIFEIKYQKHDEMVYPPPLDTRPHKSLY